MKAWFIKNKYFISDNFLKLEKLVIESAKRNNICLTIFDNIDVIKVLSEKKYEKPDFVLFWDKDIKLASFIESEGIKVFNSSNSIKICDDKSLTYLSLLKENIKQPKTIFSPLIYYHSLANEETFISFVTSHLRFPFVYKECVGSFGKQVYLINDVKEFKDRIVSSGINPFFCQEFIKNSFGKDLRLYVVGDKVVGSMKRENFSGDFRANIELGGIGSKYDANENQKNMAIIAVKKLKLNFAGVDILFGENDEPILCEVNSNAYFVGINKVVDAHIEDYIFDYILGIL